MTQEQVSNYVVLIIVVGALAIGLLSMLVGRLVAVWDWARNQMAHAVARERNAMSSRRGWDRAADEVQNQRETTTEPNRTEPAEPRSYAENREEPGLTRSFALNPQEVAAVGRMIEHKATAEKPNKASTIWAGFGIKKGESARYKRASEIYDTLFVLQPDFPALEATRQPRWESDPASLN